jgi:phosphotransferase system IIB component
MRHYVRVDACAETRLRLVVHDENRFAKRALKSEGIATGRGYSTAERRGATLLAGL